MVKRCPTQILQHATGTRKNNLHKRNSCKERKHHSYYLNITHIEFHTIHAHHKREAPERNMINHICLEKIRKFSIKIEKLKLRSDTSNKQTNKQTNRERY